MVRVTKKGNRFVLLVLFLFVLPLVLMSVEPAFAAKKMVLKMAGQNPVDHMGSLSMQRIADHIKEKTEGRIEVRTFPASQLGDYTLVYEEMMKGTIEMSLGAPPSQYDNRLQISVTPFLVTDWEQAKKEYSPGGWVFEKMKELNEKQGIIFFGFNMTGFGGIGSTKEINDVLDPLAKKNVLMRVSPLEVSRIMMVHQGYPTVSVPWADLYTALQTGVADAWVGGNPTYSYMMFRDVLKYYYQINLYMECEAYMMSKMVWDKLTPEDQKIIREIMEEEAMNSFAVGMADDKHYMDLMRKDNWHVFEYTSEELEPLRKHFVENVWTQLEGTLSKELVDEMKEYFGKK